MTREMVEQNSLASPDRTGKLCTVADQQARLCNGSPQNTVALLNIKSSSLDKLTTR